MKLRTFCALTMCNCTFNLKLSYTKLRYATFCQTGIWISSKSPKYCMEVLRWFWLWNMNKQTLFFIKTMTCSSRAPRHQHTCHIIITFVICAFPHHFITVLYTYTNHIHHVQHGYVFTCIWQIMSSDWLTGIT